MIRHEFVNQGYKNEPACLQFQPSHAWLQLRVKKWPPLVTTWRDLVKIWPPLARHSILSSDQNYKSALISRNFERSSGGQVLAINYDCHPY